MSLSVSASDGSQRGGPTTFNLATIAVWESAEAIEAAGARVREYYRSIGFDVAETLARLHIQAEIGNYHAPIGLQATTST